METKTVEIDFIENMGDTCFNDSIGNNKIDFAFRVLLDGKEREIVGEGGIDISIREDQLLHDSYFEDYRVYDMDENLIPFPGLTNDQVGDLMLEHCIKY